MDQGEFQMPHEKYQFSHAGPSAVDRACDVAKQLISSARGQYDNEQQCVEAVARKANLTPAVLRRFLQPSKRPKEVGYSVWTRLLSAYRRQLEKQLHQLEDEIARLDHLEPDDRALVALLYDAEALVSKIKATAETLPAAGADARGTYDI
jgi:hypothetical protein